MIEATTLKIGDTIELYGTLYEVCQAERTGHCFGCAFDSVDIFYINCTNHITGCCKTDFIFKEQVGRDTL